VACESAALAAVVDPHAHVASKPSLALSHNLLPPSPNDPIVLDYCSTHSMKRIHGHGWYPLFTSLVMSTKSTKVGDCRRRNRCREGAFKKLKDAIEENQHVLHQPHQFEARPHVQLDLP
jgi:hypothetical protein